MKGIFTEKHCHIKIPASDQEVTEINSCEEAGLTQCLDTDVQAKKDTVSGIIENTLATNEKPTLSNSLPLENFQNMAKNDVYGSIAKHNTTIADKRPLAGTSVAARHTASKFQVQATKRGSRIYERTFREKVIEWLKNNGVLCLLCIIIFVLAASAVGFWGALVVMTYMATGIFLMFITIMGLLKLLIPGFKIF